MPGKFHLCPVVVYRCAGVALINIAVVDYIKIWAIDVWSVQKNTSQFTVCTGLSPVPGINAKEG